MSKLSFVVVLAGVAVAVRAVAVPSLNGSVNVTQDPKTTVVTVTYALDAAGGPGIVTLDVLTNSPSGYVSVGGERLRNVTGEVNYKIATGATRTIQWNAGEAFDTRFRREDAIVRVTVWPTNAPPDYLVIDLKKKNHRFYPNAEQIPYGLTSDVYRTTHVVLRKCHAAGVTWPMGTPSASNATGFTPSGENRRLVTIPEDYYLGIFEVTQGQMRNVNLTSTIKDWCTTGRDDDDLRPANGYTFTNIRSSDWPAAGRVASRGSGVADYRYLGVSYFRNYSGLWFDLPTEVEWEYACRAGTYDALYSTGSDDFATVDDYAWHTNNVPELRPQPVGRKKPNRWGFYDMLGNVYELCLDNYRDDYGMSLADYDEVNYFGPTTGLDSFHPQQYRAVRGGSYLMGADKVRSAWRTHDKGTKDPEVGFRLRLSAVYPL